MTDNVDSDIAVDATIMKIAQAFGVHTDRVSPIVDRYGTALSEAALDMAQAEMARGFTPQSPFGYMVSLLSKGVVQAASLKSSILKRMPDATTETYTAREPAGHIWRRTHTPCAPCNEIKRGAKPSHVVAMKHSCGEAVPLAGILKQESDKRREEAADLGECKRCLGAGFVWRYEGKQNAVATVRGAASFADTAGVRYLVACECQRLKAAPP